MYGPTNSNANANTRPQRNVIALSQQRNANDQNAVVDVDAVDAVGFLGFFMSMREIFCSHASKLPSMPGILQFAFDKLLEKLGFDKNVHKNMKMFRIFTRLFCNPMKLSATNTALLLDCLPASIKGQISKNVSKMKRDKDAYFEVFHQEVANSNNRSKMKCDKDAYFNEVFRQYVVSPGLQRIELGENDEYYNDNASHHAEVNVLHRPRSIGNYVRHMYADVTSDAINKHVNDNTLKIFLGACASVAAGIAVKGTGRIVDWHELAKISTVAPGKEKISFNTFERGSKYEKWAKEFLDKWRKEHPEYLKSGSDWRSKKAALYARLKLHMSTVHTVEARRAATQRPINHIVPFLYSMVKGHVKPSEFISIKLSPTVSVLMLGFYGLFMKDEIEKVIQTIKVTDESTIPGIDQSGGSVEDMYDMNTMFYSLAIQVTSDKDLSDAYLNCVFDIFEGLPDEMMDMFEPDALDIFVELLDHEYVLDAVAMDEYMLTMEGGKKKKRMRYESMTLKDLKQLARERNIKGYSTLKKNDIINALRAKPRRTPAK